MKQNNTQKIQEAFEFAAKAHRGQVRKHNGMPYVVHTIAVADIVRKYTDDSNVVAAAALHDTVEDTDVTIFDIVENFGEEVAEYVDEVTKRSKKPDGNRAIRKSIDLKHYIQASYNGQLIKAADILHNISDLNEANDEDWKFTFLREKKVLIDKLTLVPEALVEKINQVIDSYYIELLDKDLRPKLDEMLENRYALIDHVIARRLLELGMTRDEAVEKEAVYLKWYDDYEVQVYINGELIFESKGLEEVEIDGELAYNFPYECIYPDLTIAIGEN